MSDINQEIEQLAGEMPPISLEEMSSVRLMKRTDSKFVTNTATLVRLLELAKGNYYSQSADGQRVSPYATTYWDNPEDDHFFRMHQAGHSPRMKVRVRTYVRSGHSFLEIKRKDNHGKTSKKRTSVQSAQSVMDTREGEDFLTAQTGLTFNDLTPTVGNRFNRLTLVNLDKTERLTIDFSLRFYNYQTQQESAMDNAVIIELKRDGRMPSPILPLLRKLRIKPSGFSKYCIGAVCTNPDLKVNRFKKRLIKINKAVKRATPVGNFA